MPVDPLYCPALTCAVYDYLFMGLSQPLLGTFVLDLSSIFYKQPHKRYLKIIDIAKDTKARAQDEDIRPVEEIKVPEFGDSVKPLSISDQDITVGEMDFEETIEPPKAGITAGVSRAPPEKMSDNLPVKQARKGQFVRMPIYKKNEKTARMEETNVPDPNFYMVCGYDKQPGDGDMHYRYIVKSELEESEYIDKSPF